MSYNASRSVTSSLHAYPEKVAAARCGWSYATIRRRRYDGSGPPYFQIGGSGKRVVYPVDALEAWIIANLRNGKSTDGCDK